MDWIDDGLTHRVIEAIIQVHRVLGPGFLESIYQRALLIELAKRGLRVSTEVDVIVCYEGEPVGRHRLDLLVEDRLIVELKTVEQLGKSHYAQVRSYLRAAGKPVALLVNFAMEKADYRRVELMDRLPISPHPPIPDSRRDRADRGV